MAQKITFKKRAYRHNGNKYPSHWHAVKFVFYVYMDGVLHKEHVLLEKQHSNITTKFYHVYSRGEYVPTADKIGAAFHSEILNDAKRAMIMHLNGLPVDIYQKSIGEIMAAEDQYWDDD